MKTRFGLARDTRPAAIYEGRNGLSIPYENVLMTKRLGNGDLILITPISRETGGGGWENAWVLAADEADAFKPGWKAWWSGRGPFDG